MTDSLLLTDFIPGTKAKAQEVNANFSAVKDAINTKASADGDNARTFNVATATDTTHAVNKAQMDELSQEMTQKINGTSVRFCAKSGNTTTGKADLFSYSGMNVTAKVGGSYPSLVISNYKGEFSTITAITTINMTGKTNGVYNVFVKSTGETYTLANTVYKQPDRPTMVDGDVWLNTSVEPISAIKYSGTSDVEFLDVPIGKITIASSAISAVETYPYNQNGYDVNVLTHLKSLTSNGYTKLPNGLILQWGTATNTVVHGGTCNVIFPLVFPTMALNIINTISDTINTITTLTAVPSSNLTTSGFSYQYGAINGGAYTHSARWLAIGY